MIKLKKIVYLVFILFFSLTLFACKKNKQIEHVHIFDQQVANENYLVSEATCVAKAKYYYSCKDGEKGTEMFEYGDLKAHLTTIVAGYSATCTETGLTDETKCSVCGEVIIAQQEITALAHHLVDDPRVEATLTHAGHEAGKHCTKCGYKEGGSVIPKLKYQRVDKDNKPNEKGEYILFGFYPQSKVTDETTLTTLNGSVPQTKPTKDNAQGFTSYKYYFNSSNTTDFMWYKDIDMDNDGSYDYRCVYFDQYRPTVIRLSSEASYSNQDNNGYKTNNYYFFKYDSIRWKILTQSGGKATILAELILDVQDFNHVDEIRTIEGKTIYSSNYKYSTIRSWLNDAFYNTAFKDLQKSIINKITVDNSQVTTGTNPNSYVCDNTEDNVWLISYQDVNNATYGFNSLNDKHKKTTAYAQCQGAYTSTSSKYKGNGYWWLRSPAYDNNNYVRAIEDGMMGISKYNVNFASCGVVPALIITFDYFAV